MKIRVCVITLGVALFATVPANAQGGAPRDVTKQVSFAAETPGREPKTFAPMVGSWVISRDAGRNVLFIDGRVWKRGQPAGGLADKAREL
jgi:hypothetical protein